MVFRDVFLLCGDAEIVFYPRIAYIQNLLLYSLFAPPYKKYNMKKVYIKVLVIYLNVVSMSKVEKKKPKEKEQESKWFMPSVWGSKLTLLNERITKLKEDYIPEKKGKNFADVTLNILAETIKMIDAYFEPRPPRVLEDAFNYALSRKYKGTYLALMDSENHLVRAMILNKGEIMDKIPEFHLEDRDVELKMKAKYIVVPLLDMEKVIPKRVENAIPFACDKKEITRYK